MEEINEIYKKLDKAFNAAMIVFIAAIVVFGIVLIILSNVK